MVAMVTAGLAESNGSLLPGLWLTSPAGWLPRTGISSGTLRWAMEYGLPLFLYFAFTDRSSSLSKSGYLHTRELSCICIYSDSKQSMPWPYVLFTPNSITAMLYTHKLNQFIINIVNMISPFQIIINQYTKILATFHILYNLPINLQSMCHGFFYN